VAAPRLDGLRGVEIQVGHLALALEPDRGRAAAAEARHLRLHDANREGRRDGRVHRVATGAEHVDPCLARETVGRRHDALPRLDPPALIRGRHDEAGHRARSLLRCGSAKGPGGRSSQREGESERGDSAHCSHR